MAMNNGNLERILQQMSNKIDEVKTDIRNLETKMETVQNKLETKMEAMENKLETKMEAMENKLEVKMEAMENRLEVKIEAVREQVVDLKVSLGDVKGTITQIDKRISGEELISRGAFVALIGGMISVAVKYFFFSNNL
jgi:predicted  nucleic acid-binding Zn-ribbon protein